MREDEGQQKRRDDRQEGREGEEKCRNSDSTFFNML